MSETLPISRPEHPNNDVQLLINVLPHGVQTALAAYDADTLIEVVLDLGRLPEARFKGGAMVELGQAPVTRDHIDAVVAHIGFFSSDNRGGIARTLHRISAIRNRQGDIIGLTCRVGKAITGTITPIKDLIESGKSVLLLGRPGSGKTTKLREVARLLSEESGKRVVIVDTSNEIAGDGDIPHPAVGRARRMQVVDRDEQGQVMIEAVQNHTPEVIIIDEIGTEDEAAAARTIAERGVCLIATAHGESLENIIRNPTLSDLVGGIETVTLGDDEAKRRATQKTVLERAKQPSFDICVEIRDHKTLAVYPDVAEAVDHILRGWTIFPELRKVDAETGSVKVLQPDIDPMALTEGELPSHPFDLNAPDKAVMGKRFKIFIYGISKTYVDRILERLELQYVGITKHVHEADAIIALKSSCRPGSKMMRVVEDYELPIFYTKTNTMPQIQRALREALDVDADEMLDHLTDMSTGDETEQALQEARQAVDAMVDATEPLELSPRRSYIRRLQHELVEKHGLVSFSVGDEPKRRLKILPPEDRTQAS
ncbi:MAG: AAA family ATPase [Cyanobacteria bacterium HKST-UBA04]|nr:AAA family ATPase [Cyanobacteria bacterium HKST-UBA04]MCA9840758.1 AAA family ATPase [Cyanobacteria bacterium HKST-UBA03]